MIFAIFCLFLLLGFALVSLGSYNKEIVLELLGFLLIFLMGIVLLNSGIDYQTGETINTNYTYTALNLTDTTTSINSYTYENYKNHTIGYFLTVISLLGFAYCWFSFKGDDQE